MATKDDLQSLGKSSQKGSEELKDKLKSDHEEIIVSNAQTIHELQIRSED